LDADIDFGAQPATASYSFRARMSAAPGAAVTAGRVKAGAEVNFTFY
jgi:type 1 fimbria pilin